VLVVAFLAFHRILIRVAALIRRSSLILASVLATACGGTQGSNGGDAGSAETSHATDAGGGDGHSRKAPANPLEGMWTYTQKSGGVTLVSQISFDADGVLVETVQVTGCVGVETITGLAWKATGTTLVMDGTTSCSGTIECAGVTSECGSGPPEAPVSDTTCGYAFSKGGNTLTLMSCTGSCGDGGDIVLTRD
jgi:hypothetical protein